MRTTEQRTTEQRTTKRDILIPDDTDGTHIATEYGCRFPDGHKEWNTFTSINGVSYAYAAMIPGSRTPYSERAVKEWDARLQGKAKDASIHPSEFIEDHTLIKRTIIIVTTKAEEL